MACRAIGHGRSPFVHGKQCFMEATAKPVVRSSSSLSMARKFPAVGTRGVVCRLSLPVSSKGETIPHRAGNGSEMTEICRSPLHLSPVSDPLEVRRKEDASTPPRTASAENLDRWMKESVTEIVRNIQEAPFFVCLYSTEKSGSANLETEFVGAHDCSWSRMKGWVAEKRPDGIILIEELKQSAEEESSRTKCSKLWGLLIQVRGIDLAACYILKTTRVCSALGLCTHFCLIRAKCYGDPVEIQLRDSWLNLGL